jgi:hypothetical protein
MPINRAVSLPDTSRSSDRKDSTPRTAGGCCIHPPGRYETIAVTPALGALGPRL